MRAGVRVRGEVSVASNQMDARNVQVSSQINVAKINKGGQLLQVATPQC